MKLNISRPYGGWFTCTHFIMSKNNIRFKYVVASCKVNRNTNGTMDATWYEYGQGYRPELTRGMIYFKDTSS